MTGPLALTLGPVLFNWPGERWRDFHFRIADEAPVDSVCVGETVCSKRAPFWADHLPAVIDRLTAAGKEVVLSSPILPTTERERAALRDLAAADGPMVEANDMGCVHLLGGRPHRIGPTVNVYNEGTLAWLARRGAVSVALNPELPGPSVGVLATAARDLGVAIEVQVFGRMPLAISARCYHARSHGLHKDGCQFVCGEDPDGMSVRTLDDEPFLAVNGTQTLSHAYLSLARELDALRDLGVRRFRLSPHSVDMVAVAEGFRDALDGRIAGAELAPRIAGMVAGMNGGTIDGAAVANGYFHDRPGAGLLG